MTLTLFISIFFSTLVSGWHCALMCSGFVSSSREQVIRFANPKTILLEHLLLHTTRIFTYTLLGALAGNVGAIVWLQDILPVQRVMFLIASSLLITQALRILFGKRLNFIKARSIVLVEKRIAVIWSYISSQMSSLSNSKIWQNVSKGFIWGLVPCGLVYSALSLAFLSGSSWHGALLLFAMGLGTIPNLLLIAGGLGKFNSWLAHVGFSQHAKIFTAMLLIFSGLWGVYHAFTLPEELLKKGFCFN